MESTDIEVTLEPKDPKYPTKKFSNITHAFNSLKTGKKYDAENLEDSDMKYAKELFLKWDKIFRDEEKDYREKYPEAWQRHQDKLKAIRAARAAKKGEKENQDKKSALSQVNGGFVIPHDEMARKIFEGRVMELAECVEKYASEFSAKKQRLMECLQPSTGGVPVNVVAVTAALAEIVA
jgi:hypothetical protein